MLEGRLTGKRVLVTGAGTGIGRGIALRMAEEGANVLLHYAHSEKGAMEGRQIISEMGGTACTIQADLSSSADCRKMITTAADMLGGLDILVNNSGITRAKPIMDITGEDLNELYAVNFRSYFLCAQETVRTMLGPGHSGGSIINISSVHGFGGVPNNSVYAAMKGAVNALTRQLAIELADKKIRVNAIAPGHVEVERHFTYAQYSTESGSKGVPIGRVGTPRDIADLALFLASGESGFITGQVIYADGGLTAKLALPARNDQ